MSEELIGSLEGFPSLKRILRDRTAKMLACQAAWRWPKEPVKSELSFKSNHYRAMLEVVLSRIEGINELPRLGGFPTSALKSFDGYCRIAFERVQLPFEEALVEEVRIAYDTEANLRRLALVWTMRALLGAVLEAVIIQDRVAFLRETLPEGSRVDCVPVFDPVQSPRNLAIMARKPIA